MVISFNIYNTPVSWQTYINKVLGPLLNDICVAFLDNILIWGDSDEEVKVCTFKVLDYLCEEGLYYKLFKYYFKVNEIDFLEYLVGYDKLYMNSDWV